MTKKPEPYRKRFVLIVDSRTRQVDVMALRARIGAMLAARRRRGLALRGCRTIQGPGNVIVCDGDCSKPGELCDVKVVRRPGGHFEFTCGCQKPVTQPLRRRRSHRPTARP